MRDHSSHVEVSRDKAIELLLGIDSFDRRKEIIPVTQGYGRVLASDACALLDMPNCLTCCMDSVAVHWDDFANGMPDTTGWQRGNQWQFANTGIGMPVGFDTAIVIENVELADDYSWIKFKETPSRQYAGTSPTGSRMHKGDVLVKAGCVLTPLLLSLIAAGNNTEIEVIAKPKVAFIPTGGELVGPGSEIPRGKNIETNSILAAGKIAGWGGECTVFDIVPDSPALIREAVLEAVKENDIVILNAGSSKGSDDWNVEMLEEVGRVLYHETNHGPGHHSSGAVVENTPVIGISGPPGGAAFTMDFYVYPVMMQYLGQPTLMKRRTVRLEKGFAAKKKLHTAGRGEVRPSIVADHRTFYGVKQLKFVENHEDATLSVVPGSSTHLGQVEAETMDCYYLLDNDHMPQEGGLIEVEVRP